MKSAFVLCAALVTSAAAQSNPLALPALTVHSPRVANQTPAATFAMPVTALRYEPQVDIHGRNLAEGQADITLRGGIFEQTGFQLGALTLADPQTGHYLAELPVAPAMLQAPQLKTGADLALGPLNASVGAIAYGWRRIPDGGMLRIGAGEHRARRAEVYQGANLPANGGVRIGADVDVAYSESRGSVPWGEHRFDRVVGRFQLGGASAQTDIVAGYQAKTFGWPNLYTPFNSNETENLQTTLFALNHRLDRGAGDFLEAGAYHRRNKDDYAFNRFAPVGPVHPFQHTTWVTGGAVGGRESRGSLALNYRAELSADEITSTSLTFGRFRSRTHLKAALLPEVNWADASGARTTLRGGAVYDDTNRDPSGVSPVLEFTRTHVRGPLRRLRLSATETSQVATYTALNSSATGGLFRGNPNLGRQTSRNLEIGFDAAVADWTTQAAVFWRRDEALVDWTFRRGVTARTANAVDVDVAGFELLARRSWRQVDLVLGYTALTKDPDYRGAPVDASFYALNYARHRFTAAIVARLGAGFELRMDNVARVQATNLLRTVGGDDAVISSAALAYRPPTWAGVEFAVLADNLWASDFQEVPAVPAPGRQVSATVTYAW